MDMNRAIRHAIAASLCALLFTAFPLQGQELAPKKSSQSVWLTVREVKESRKGIDHGILVREVFRQSLWMAATDAGISVSDSVLREQRPATSATSVPLILDAEIQVGKNAIVHLSRGEPGSAKEVWKAEVPLAASSQSSPDFRELVQVAEKLSREGLPEALKSAGLSIAQQPKAKPQKLSVQKELRQLNPFDQFTALRRAHKALRADGSDMIALEALTLGYANFGDLSRHFWNSTPKVFMARSLLYSQRLVVLHSDSERAIWAQAYALALTGLHGAALDAMNEIQGSPADKEDASPKDSSADASARPSWAGLLKPLCEFRTEELLKAAKRKTADSGLALYFAFLTVERGPCAELAIRIGDQILEKQPESFRVYDSMCQMGGITTLHKLTLKGPAQLGTNLVKHLESFRDLPASVRSAIKSAPSAPPDDDDTDDDDDSDNEPGDIPEVCVAVPQLAKALVETGTLSAESVQPSWGVLGRMIEETLFLQIYRRVDFMKNMWAVEYGDFLKKVSPMIRTHPYARMISAMGFEPKREIAEINDAFDSVKMNEPNLSLFSAMRRILRPTGEGSRERSSKIWRFATEHADMTEWEMWQCLKFINKKDIRSSAEATMRVSPFCPLTYALLIKNDWQYSKKHADEWARLHGNQPILLEALASKYAEEKDFVRAEQFYRRFLDLSHDQAIYQKLADVFLAQGDREKWKSTLEEALKQPDLGLGHMTAQVSIADYLMSEKKWNEALPFAEAAAESYAGAALNCVCRCQEGLGHWKETEQWIKQIGERYDDRRFTWFYWCLRTGHGDLKAARKYALDVAQAALSSDSTPMSTRDGAAFVLQFSGKHDKAMQTLADSFRANHLPYTGWLMICFSDPKTDRKLRDDTLRQIAAMPPPKQDLESENLIELAKIFGGTSGAKADVSRIEALADRAKGATEPNICYFAGRLLDMNGQPEAAKKLLIRASQWNKGLVRICQISAIELLRKKGVNVDPVVPGPD